VLGGDESVDDGQQLLLGLRAQSFDLPQPPLQARAQGGWSCLALGCRSPQQLIDGGVQHERELGQEARRRVIALGLVAGDATAGDAELGGQLLLGEAAALRMAARRTAKPLPSWGVYLGMGRLIGETGCEIYTRFPCKGLVRGWDRA
jgi:hypothetical protein